MSYATGKKYIREDKLPLMWCSGCGNGIALSALLRAIEELDYEKKDFVFVTGIGCWGKAGEFVNVNVLHPTHGRALPFSIGIKSANPKLHVIVLMGDGDGATIGGNHLIHAARRNIDVTAIIVNNCNYGMTGGQLSALTPADKVTATSVAGNPERAFDLCNLVEAAGANYVARETAYNGMNLKARIKEGLQKKGFSLIEVISPCTTLFGPRNQMKQPVQMMEWLKEKGVPVAKYNQIENAAVQGYYRTGKLVDKDEPDFTTRYQEMRDRMTKA
jgi:2-oxoglutarate ferredoxin oxidoreductase subunit beta